MYVRIITDLKYALITRDYSNLKMIYIGLNKKCSYQEKLDYQNYQNICSHTERLQEQIRVRKRFEKTEFYLASLFHIVHRLNTET